MRCGRSFPRENYPRGFSGFRFAVYHQYQEEVRMHIFGIIILSAWLLFGGLLAWGWWIGSFGRDDGTMNEPLVYAAVLVTPVIVATIVWAVIKVVQVIN